MPTETILDVIDAADAMLAAELVEPFDQRHTVELLSVQTDRPAMLEIDGEIQRFIGRLGRIDRPGEGVGRRLIPGIFENAGLAAAAKQVQIDAIRTLFCRFDGDAVLGGESDLLIAAHLPFADGGDDFQIRRQRLEGDVEADLIVALAGAAVRDGDGVVFAGGIDHQLGDERPAQRRGQRIFALVERAGHQGGKDETIDEQIAGIQSHGIHGSGSQRFLADAFDVLALAEIDREGDHIEVVLLADPRHHDAGVESAGIGEDDFIACHGSPHYSRSLDFV